MVFSDLFFLFAFIPAFAICYLLAGLWRGGLGARNIILVIFSLIFYAWGEPVYVLLMLFSVLLNYLSGLAIGKTQGTGRRWALIMGLVCNLLILGTFKYLGFFVQTLASIGISVSAPTIALPIGISFYTFQSISYLIDVYRNESPVQKRFRDLLLYISMFPQLIAGPIVRYGTIAHEIHNRQVTANDLADGIYRFLRGLGKKVILANQLSDLSSQFLANELNDLTTTGAWLGIVAFTLQIYFDFSGYSDMAIGLGRCLGFHFNENFRHPYCCNSITDFWRRWHISLGSFFRDYVYIPMGGNRSHQALNILVVWFLTGMWHGASWNFIIWGVYFGIIVMLEKYTMLRIINKVPAVFLHIYSLLLVVIGWGIFYFDDFSQMTVFFQRFFGQAETFHDFLTTSAITDNFWMWVLALLFCMPVRSTSARLLARITHEGSNLHQTLKFSVRLAVSLLMLILSVALLVGATNNAFIYTRF
ncbi:MBOAT family O-acyltransferase [uncultured Prevotella sp.]|uniref:MBOAT family O-acyltransferase n=1 Tax=uncultured Prevotella sp. TaxID=159272 RepID=UPI0025E6F1F6|nr:MBOAT family O-acyltransferase [uncultured Prevotella sp.]